MFTAKDTKQQQNALASALKNRGRSVGGGKQAIHSMDSLHVLQRSLGNGYLQTASQTGGLTPCELRLQRACACGGACASCGQREDDQPKIQTKLAVGSPDDVYEQEADRVADQIMRMPESITQRIESEEEEKIGELQRKVEGNSAVTEVPPVVHEVLQSPGQPLDLATRAFMEPRFGHDFSQVRVHTDAGAAESARAVNALAYTVGWDVIFNKGHYAPDSILGKRLLAHELTHVLQQCNRNPFQQKLELGTCNDFFEQVADYHVEKILNNDSGTGLDLISLATSSASPHSKIIHSGELLQRTDADDPSGKQSWTQTHHPAPAGPFTPPPGPVPGSPEEAFEEGRRSGVLFGNKIGWAKHVLGQLQGGIAGEFKGKNNTWNTRMSASDRIGFLNGVLNALAQLPAPPEYPTKERQDAAERGFREGLGQGKAQAAAEVFGLWATTQLAIAIATEGAIRLPAPSRSVTLGATGARLGGSVARTEAEIQRAAEAAYESIRAAGKEQFSTVAKNTGFSEKTLSDLYEHIFLKEHEIPIGPNAIELSRFKADIKIAGFWQKARSGPLEGNDLATFRELMAHEGVEMRLMREGLPYQSLSADAWSWENVNGEEKWIYRPKPGAYGAHDIAPLADPEHRGPLEHWIKLAILGQ